jgi:hypothetical protein
LTLGGPILPGVRFFVANQYSYVRNGSARFIEPFSFDNLVQDNLGAPRKLGEPLPAPVQMLKNGSVNQNWNWNNTAQGNLLFDMAELANIPMKIRFSGNYAFGNSINGGAWPGLANIFRKSEKMSRNDANTAFGNIRLTHFLSQTTFYEVGLSYTRQWGRTYDDVFGDDWIKYPDRCKRAGRICRIQRLRLAHTIHGSSGYDFDLPVRIQRSRCSDQRLQQVQEFSDGCDG